YQFPHALLRETAYEQIFREDRMVMHKARALDLMHRKPQDLAIIASHFEHGQDRESAKTYYHKAAEAVVIGDTESAVRFFRKAYNLADQPSEKIKILRGWSESIHYGGRYAEHKEVHELSLSMLDKLPLVDRVGVHLRSSRFLRRELRYSE